MTPAPELDLFARILAGIPLVLAIKGVVQWLGSRGEDRKYYRQW